MSSGIYGIVNKTNDKIYVGSSNNIFRRCKRHFYELQINVHSNRHLQSAWNKYEAASFEFIILENCSVSELIKREQHWLDFYKSYDENLGYNIRKIADNNSGLIFTEEHKRKLSEANKGRKVLNPRRGFKLSLDQIQKLRLIHKGKILSKETRARMSIAKKGVVKSKEWQDKITAALTGRKQTEKEIKSKILSLRDFENWPHEKGWYCECAECREKKRIYNRNYMRVRRANKNLYTESS